MKHRYLRLLTVPGLRPVDRMVWSRLARAARYDKGMTIGRLAREMGLDRCHEVPSSLKRLEAKELAEKRSDGWWARKPAAGSFVKRDAGGLWQDQIHYMKVIMPSKECPVNSKVMVLHALIQYLNEKKNANYSISNMARLLNIDRKTVRRWLKQLFEHGLVTHNGRRFIWA